MRLAMAVVAFGAGLWAGAAAAQSDDVVLKTFGARAKVCGIMAAKAEACGVPVPERASRAGIVAQARERGHSAAVQDGLAAAYESSREEAARTGGCTDRDRSRVAETLPMCVDMFD